MLYTAASSLYVPSTIPLAIADDSVQTNVLIDRDFHPRLTDYGIVATVPDLNAADPRGTAFPAPNVARFMAPELLNPSGFGLRDSNPTKKSDIYAYGAVMYQVSNPRFIPDMVTKGGIQVITEQQPFHRANVATVTYNIVTGKLPDRPPGPNAWLSDDVWNFISRCWSPSLNDRPDIDSAIKVLNDAADGGKGTSSRVSGASYKGRSRAAVNFSVDRRSPAESRPTEASSRRYTNSTSPSPSPTNLEDS